MKPLALDLFCGGGGACEGLQRAGFDVVGVDIVAKHAKHYPGRISSMGMQHGHLSI